MDLFCVLSFNLGAVSEHRYVWFYQSNKSFFVKDICGAVINVRPNSVVFSSNVSFLCDALILNFL